MRKPAILIAIVTLVAIGCGPLSLREERRMVNAIPTPPGTIRRARFHTTWPDSIPAAGWLYTTNEQPDVILDFYKRELLRRGWKLIFEHGPTGFDTQGILKFAKDGFYCTITVSGKEPPYRVTVSVRKAR